MADAGIDLLSHVSPASAIATESHSVAIVVHSLHAPC